MRRAFLCLFYTACVLTLLFSLGWLASSALPKQENSPAESGIEEAASSEEISLPVLAAQIFPNSTAPAFYLCDSGGRVAVYRCDTEGLPTELQELTDIYVNLLPEADALRLKQGFTVQDEQALAALLEDLGA
jgi:hypothetical protein